MAVRVGTGDDRILIHLRIATVVGGNTEGKDANFSHNSCWCIHTTAMVMPSRICVRVCI